jgi:hypothetical protein
MLALYTSNHINKKLKHYNIYHHLGVYIQRRGEDFSVALATKKLHDTCTAWVQAMEWEMAMTIVGS